MPLAVFGLFAVVVFWLLDLFAGRRNRTSERLDELRNPLGRRRDQGKKQDAMSKMLEKATPVLAAPLQPKTEAETGKLQQKLIQAGFRGPAAGGTFLGLKFVGLLVGLFLGGGTLFLTSGANTNTMMYTVMLTAFFFYMPDLSCGSSAAVGGRRYFCRCPTRSTCWSCAWRQVWGSIRQCEKWRKK